MLLIWCHDEPLLKLTLNSHITTVVAIIGRRKGFKSALSDVSGATVSCEASATLSALHI